MHRQRRRKMFPPIKENEYKERMYGEVLPYLDDIRVSGNFERIPGESIYYENYDAKDAKGTVVFLHGYSDGLPKHYESVYYFLKNGYNVRQLQQRGHGKSYRGTFDASLIHIESYPDLILDLDYYVRHVVITDNKCKDKPLHIFGHSMGGAVAARYLQVFPEIFDKAILSSPMMELKSGKHPMIEEAVKNFMVRSGRGERYVKGTGPYNGSWTFDTASAGTKCRFDYYFDVLRKNEIYRTWGPSWSTALEFSRLTNDVRVPEECERIEAECIILAASNDALVTLEGQEQFDANVEECCIYVMPNCKHDIFSSHDETLEIYWKVINAFLES